MMTSDIYEANVDACYHAKGLTRIVSFTHHKKHMDYVHFIDKDTEGQAQVTSS